MGVFSGSLVATLALAGASASGAFAAPLYPQCPPVGNNQGCSQLITIPKAGLPVVNTDPNAPANGYDGAEDTLIGVQNNSSKPVTSLNLASPSANIFGFDGDGLCNPSQWPSAPATTPPGCPGPQGFGTSGYEGPGTSFSNISGNQLTGTLNFSPALQPGKSAYFALEEALKNGQLRSSTRGPVAGPITLGPGHSVTFQLTCVGQKNCVGSVQLVIIINGQKITAVISKKHKVTLGKTHVSISSGGTVTVLIKLNKKGKQLVKHHRKFKAGVLAHIAGQKFILGTVKL